MMHDVTPLGLMAAGLVLLVVSWLVILLMVIGQITASLLLSLGAYAASVAGLAIGLFGVVQYVRKCSCDEESGVGGGRRPG